VSRWSDPGSYTGSSITFGMTAELAVRKHRLQTYCPTFTLRFDEPGTMSIEAPGDQAAGQKGYATRQKIITQVPLRAIDFESAPFARHDLKGVRLGPVLDPRDVGPLPTRKGSADLSKNFQREVATERAVLRKQAAAAEVTGWPWDILYFAQYLEELQETSSSEAFGAAVLERYGKPSSLFECSGYMVWLYDLDGQKLDLGDAGSDACRATAQLWLSSDPLGRVYSLGWEPNSYDIGPGGASS
jgi:hypothetical protein